MVGLVNREGLMTTAAYGAVDAAVDLYPDAGDRDRRRGQRDGRAEHRRRAAGAASAQITRAGVMINLAMTGVLTVLLLLFDRPLLVLFLGADSPAMPIAAAHPAASRPGSFMLFGRDDGAVRRRCAPTAWWSLPLIIMVIALYPVRLGFYYLDLRLARRRRDLVVVPGRLAGRGWC